MNSKIAISVLIIIILLVGLVGWYTGQENVRACKGAGYADYHEDSTGGYCYLWEDGRKVLTPFEEVGK